MTLLMPGEGRRVTALGSTYVTKTDGSDTAGAYSLVEEELWGQSTPLHTHTAAEEAFYVLSGRAAVWLDGTESQVAAGSFLLVPRGAPHALKRLGDEPVRMLTVISPAGLQAFFDAVVEQGEEELLADPERLVALAAEYDTEVLGDYPSR